MSSRGSRSMALLRVLYDWLDVFGVVSAASLPFVILVEYD